MKHEANCSFVKLNKQDEKKWTVDELYDLYKQFKIKEYVSIVYSLHYNSTVDLFSVFNLRLIIGVVGCLFCPKF